MKYSKLAVVITILAGCLSPSLATNEVSPPRKQLRGDKNVKHRKLILYTAEEGGIENAYIVKLKEGGASVFASDVANRMGVNVTRMYSTAIQGFAVSGVSSEQALALAQDPQVEYVEQDGVVSVNAVGSWGLDRVDQNDLPLDDTYNPTFGNGGAGVTAYIIDTGIQPTHSDFGGRATQEYNSADNTDTDCNGHGTHVAGTVGGTQYGIAKNVNLVGVKVLACNGSGSYSGVIAGIEWVMNNAENRKPATANMSLGGGRSSSVNTAVKNLVASGVSTVVAAGNSDADACNASPASEPTAITVGSTTRTDSRSYFSNWGNCLDIFAPGSSITSAWIGNDAATRTISGTSMASPHVCGAAALYLGDNSNLSTDDVAALLIDGASPNKVTDPETGSPNRLLYLDPPSENNAPSMSPAVATMSPAPTVSSAVIACGAWNRCNQNTDIVPVSSPQAVRCCSDVLKSGWTKWSECDVWGESDLPVCYGAETLASAENICASQGARLCTPQEMRDDCTRTSGCGFDRKMVWTAEKPPTLSPAPSPTVTPSVIACGKPGRCPNDLELAPSSSPQAVRCCSGTQKEGWKKNPQCSVWGESNLPGCNSAATLDAASNICSLQGARLCTAEEILGSCTSGSGCGFDNSMVWTSDDELPDTELVVCGASHGTCRFVGEKTVSVLSSQAVRCCSDDFKSGWRQWPGCDVWGESDLPGCNKKETLASAEDICASQGARLCTPDEIRSDCTKNSGCGFDSQFVWTSTGSA